MFKKKAHTKISAMILAVVFMFSMLPVSVFATEVAVSDSYLGTHVSPEVPDSFQNDLWLQYEQKEIAVGETTKIVPRRVEEAVTNSVTNDVKLPNFNYEIISGDSITLDTTNNAKAIVTGVKKGDTVVKITYDALTHTNGKVFPATDDVNTAYCVISVGGDESITFDTSITKVRGDKQTANENPISYDTLYYKDGDTLPFEFTAKTNAKTLVVTVNGIEISGTDGKYVAQLENRSNIIMMKATNADGSTNTYARIIDARKFEVIVTNKTNPDQEPKVGDTVNISFNGIVMPVYKLATIYNPQMGSWGGKVTRTVYTSGEDTYEGKCGQYDLATNNDFDYVCKEAGEIEFTNGHIFSAWWGSSLETEKNQDGVGEPNLGAPTLEGDFSTLADFSITVKSDEPVQPVETIDVNVSFEKDNVYSILPETTVSVSSDLSDKYGYKDEVKDGVSALDALIKTHEMLYDDFTVANKDKYLAVADSGFITTVTGIKTSDFGFVVNGLMPNDGKLNPVYGTYTGYTQNQTKLANNDVVQYFFYNPEGYYGEIYSNFTKDGERVTELTMQAGTEEKLGLQGFSYMYEGCNEKIVWKPVKNVKVATVTMDGKDKGKLVNLDKVVSDDKGEFTLKFAEEGTYYLAVNSDPDNFTYVIPQILKVTVEPAPKPTYPTFDALEVMTTALADSSVWVKDETYKPDVFSYDLGTMKETSTGIMFSGISTKFDIEKYDSVVKYTDANGDEQTKNFVNNGKISLVSCANLALGKNSIEVVIFDKANEKNSTTYTFNVVRPYSTKNVMGSNSIVVTPADREVSKTPYKNKLEGTLFRVIDGVEGTATGVYSTCDEYNAYLLNNSTSFNLKLVPPAVGAKIRYSIDDKKTWTEYTDIATIKAGDVKDKTVYLQVISADVAVNGTGFENAEDIKDYKVTVYFPSFDTKSVEMKTASVDVGKLGQNVTAGVLTYYNVVPNDFTTSTLTYTVADGAVVTINKEVQTPNADGTYSVEFKAQTKIIVSTADGVLANTYVFNIAKKSAYDMPDEVVDFLVVNSQYTNTSPYALYPETSITTSSPMKSLGNFGGHITYKYNKPLVDDPNNKFGIDFYVQGNAMIQSGTGDTGSFREPGQVWVSEDNVTWYALAGSEHYEDTTITDYEIKYTKTADGKTSWTNNQGESETSNYNFPSNSIYHLYNYGINKDEITLSGVYLPAGENGYACATKFGYSDALVNSKQDLSTASVIDTNPYVEYTATGSGFDLAWAVDENGQPVDVSDKEFSYVKVVTASNIVAGGLGEKSTEINGVIRTTAQEKEVGQTKAPTGVTLGDVVVNFEAGKTSYDVVVDEEVTAFDLTVNGATDTDNIYVNNQRIASTEKATGFVFGDDNEKTVRVIVQNGDAQPYIAVINVTNAKQKPVEPTNVKATQSSESVINVSWDAVDGVDGYVVYRVVNGKDVYFKTIKDGATSVSNTGKVANTTYTYKVRAYVLNNKGKKLYSEFVETSCTTDKIDLTKVKIENLKAVAKSESAIAISWDKADKVSAYEVYRVVNGKDYFYKTTKATSIVNAGKNADTTYTYKVRGYVVEDGVKVYTDFSTVSGKTDKAPVDVTKVEIKNLKAVAKSTSVITISWDKAEGVSAYEVYRVVNGKDYLYKSTENTSLNNAGKKAKTTYTYKVRGYVVEDGAKVYTDFATVTCTTPVK